MADPISSIMTPDIDILDKIGVFKRIEQRLFNAPDEVLEGLNKIFSEFEKSFYSMSYILDRFTTLSFNTNEDISKSKDFLNKIRNGNIEVPTKDPNRAHLLIVQLKEAQASCTEIYSLYSQHLRGWISKVFRKDQSLELENFFENDVTQYDERFLETVNGLERYLSDAAGQIVPLLDDPKDIPKAKEELTKFSSPFNTYRLQLKSDFSTFLGLKNEFIKKSKAKTPLS
jgi:hypothetical protein